MRHLRATAPLLALVVASCGAGDPTYYRLAPWPGAVQTASSGIAVEVHAPAVAAYLDRDYIVERVSDYRLHLAGNDAWAEPIGDMIGRTLVSDLAQRLPGDRVAGDADNGMGSPDARVDLDIARFDRDESGAALLHGTLTLHDATGAVLLHATLDLASPGTGEGSAAFTAAESRLLGEVADRAAATLATWHPILPAVAPAPPAG